jgi:hypothetical protein
MTSQDRKKNQPEFYGPTTAHKPENSPDRKPQHATTSTTHKQIMACPVTAIMNLLKQITSMFCRHLFFWIPAAVHWFVVLWMTTIVVGQVKLLRLGCSYYLLHPRSCRLFISQDSLSSKLWRFERQCSHDNHQAC